MGVKTFKRQLKKSVEAISREWTQVQPAWLGNYAGDVLTDTPGIYYARLANGQVIQVHNSFGAPPTYDLHVKIGRNRNQRKIWQIIQVFEDFDTPATAGEIAYHHEQHMFGHGDMLPVDRKQVMALTVMVSDAENFIVTLYGDSAVTPNGLVEIASQTLDLSSYVPTAGAVFIGIESDDDGTVSLHTGSNFGAPLIATIDDVPVPDPGQYLIAYVMLFEGQTELTDDTIHVPMPLGMVAKSTGLQIGEAAADTPASGDKFGFWDIVDLALKSITLSNLKALFFSDSEGDPADVTTGSAADGTSTYAARRDHVHHIDLEPIGQYRQFTYVVSGGDFSFIIDVDGNPVMALQDLE